MNQQSNTTVHHYVPYICPSNWKIEYVYKECRFIEAVGAKLGFPRKTIASAQNLYHRLHCTPGDDTWTYKEASLAALCVSAKIHDTLKKPREILTTAYIIRLPKLASNLQTSGDLGIDPDKFERGIQHILRIERRILELVCFNFTSRAPFPYVIKFGRILKAPKSLTKLAWRLAVDSHCITVNVEFPPHTVALACIYLAGLLSSCLYPSTGSSSDIEKNQQIAAKLDQNGPWELWTRAKAEDIQVIAYRILELIIYASQAPPILTSPPSPSRPTEIPKPPPPALPYTVDVLVDVRTALLDKGLVPRQRWGQVLAESRGKERPRGNRGTVRYQFLPDVMKPPPSPVHPYKAQSQMFGGKVQGDSGWPKRWAR